MSTNDLDLVHAAPLHSFMKVRAADRADYAPTINQAAAAYRRDPSTECVKLGKEYVTITADRTDAGRAKAYVTTPFSGCSSVVVMFRIPAPEGVHLAEDPDTDGTDTAETIRTAVDAFRKATEPAED